MDTSGNQIIPFEELNPADIVVIPAFGTTLAIEKKLNDLGIEVRKYDTTCPFVERVWKKSEKLGEEKYTIIIHGKYNHEETRATFSRSEKDAPSIVVKNIAEAKLIGDFILGKTPLDDFEKTFNGRYSEGFNPTEHFSRVGVINQTTMLATETQEIADYFKNVMLQKFGEASLKDHFADTRDTLCYATNENQEATYGLLEKNADLAIVVGGYNSSNTSHIVELCEEKLPTFFISSATEIVSKRRINHFDYKNHEHLVSDNYLPEKNYVEIILTSGASCPDSVVDSVLQKILSYYPEARGIEEVLTELESVK
jgi:4-hydroxy-3-methylbut-2-enyl diphosphate reductase